MRRSYLSLIVTSSMAFVLGFFLVCTIRSAKPDAGHQVVLIDKPLLFGHGGVDPQPVATGRSYVWFTTQRVDVNMQPMQFTIHFDDLMSSDGVPLDFDSVIRLKVTDSVKLISEFGPEWYENNVEAEFRNRARQAVRKHGMNEAAIETSAIEEIDAEITAEMTAYITQSGLPLHLIDVTVGKAAADNAYRLAMSMTPELYVELQRIEMQREVCGAEKAGCTFILGADVAPVLNAR